MILSNDDLQVQRNDNMNEIQALFDRYKDKCLERLCRDYICEPATQEQLQVFLTNCKVHDVPIKITNELVDYHKQNNSFFDYFRCDDLSIFEWHEGNCLWLGQVDFWTFRCLISKHKYAIGDASDDSFGKDYEFDTIEQMLQTFLSRDKV